MTTNQLKLLGMARSWASKSIPDFDDGQFRMILRNIGGLHGEDHPSSKSLDNRGFEQVMAYFESVGFSYEKPHAQGQQSLGYWNSKASRASRNEITDRQIRMIEQLSSDLCSLNSDFSLTGFIHRMTAKCIERTADLTALNWREAYNVIEALKAMISRPASTPQARQERQEAPLRSPRALR